MAALGFTFNPATVRYSLPPADFRQAVRANGYRPVPVKTGGKAPAGLGWPDMARRSPPPCAVPGAAVDPSASNTGLLCDGLRAIDIDIDDEAVAERVEAVARELLGEAPTRWRPDSPRVLLLYRAAEGAPSKRALTGRLGKVEVLGRGQQFVANGTHPDGADLQWHGGSPDTVRLDDLGTLTEDEVSAFFAEVASIIGASLEQERQEAPKQAPPPTAGQPTRGHSSGDDRHAAYAARALAGNAAELAAATSDRNNTLNAVSFRLGRMVARGWIERGEVEAALTAACDANGLVKDDGPRSVRATIASGLAAGIASPHDDLLDDADDAEVLALGAASAKALMKVTAKASTADETEGPLPLFPDTPPAVPYPLDALGPILAPAARAIASKVQVPAAIAGQSVLAAAALAAQGHADVALPHGQTAPLSLFFATIAASGDRKSATDNEALRPVRMREKALRDEYSNALSEWKVNASAWAAERKKIENDKKLLGLIERQAKIESLGPEPSKPLHPVLTVADLTGDGLVKNLPAMHGAVGIFTAEGGTFTGGHGMSDENRLRTAALLSDLWNAAPITRTRAGDGVTILVGRRLSLHLMVQPDAAAAFLGNPVLRDQGLVSRILVAQPESMAGSRLYRDTAPADEVAIRTYTGQLLRLLELPPPLAGEAPNELAPAALTMTPDAVAAWREFFDTVERRLAPGGSLAGLKDFASKAAENAARIAGVLTIVQNPHADAIHAEAMRNAVTLMTWYVDEAARLRDAPRADPRLQRAALLLDWLSKNKPGVEFTRANITKNGPGSLRNLDTVQDAIAVLIAHGWVAATAGKRFRLTTAGGK